MSEDCNDVAVYINGRSDTEIVTNSHADYLSLAILRHTRVLVGIIRAFTNHHFLLEWLLPVRFQFLKIVHLMELLTIVAMQIAASSETRGLFLAVDDTLGVAELLQAEGETEVTILRNIDKQHHVHSRIKPIDRRNQYQAM